MNIVKRTLILFLFTFLMQTTITAQYVETINKKVFSKNMKTNYQLVDDNGLIDQSSKLQKAIDEVSKKGGGKIIIPKGTYSFSNVYMKSDVHLFFEKNTIIKPFCPKGEKVVVFNFTPQSRKGKKSKKEKEKEFIKNVSIRGIGGKFIIDYSEAEGKRGIRGIILKMVNNFLISDLDIKDNYSVYCGITLSPTSAKRNVSKEKWKVSRATNGTIRNCRIFNASPGYGLVQLHGAQSVHFENLYALGGVTLRLETGSGGANTGVFDITGKDIVSENGRCALMLGPHSAKNGVVKVDGVKSISSQYAVQVGQGGVKAVALERDPKSKPGSFAKGTSVKNIHAIFGTNAQIKKHSMQIIPTEYYSSLKLWNDGKFFDGCSVGAVSDSSEEYKVILENISQEGFKYNTNKNILTPKDEKEGSWSKTFKTWMAENRKSDSNDWRVNKGFPKPKKKKKKNNKKKKSH